MIFHCEHIKDLTRQRSFSKCWRRTWRRLTKFWTAMYLCGWRQRIGVDTIGAPIATYVVRSTRRKIIRSRTMTIKLVFTGNFCDDIWVVWVLLFLSLINFFIFTGNRPAIDAIWHGKLPQSTHLRTIWVGMSQFYVLYSHEVNQWICWCIFDLFSSSGLTDILSFWGSHQTRLKSNASRTWLPKIPKNLSRSTLSLGGNVEAVDYHVAFNDSVSTLQFK